MKSECKGLLASAIACALLPNARAFAQGSGLEEILVTAQRREQSLQDVPISVTAVTGEAIAEGGFSDVEDMSVFVPNLFMRDAFTGQSIIVRGIGTSTGNEAFEQAVASFSDGVYYGRDNLGQGAVFDLERVEVVRGPQPTFAGQSATAGAINVITRKPGETWDGNASVAYGSDEETSFDFAAGGPLSDKFGIRFAGRYYDLDDAGYTSIVGNVPQGVKENTAARVTAVWQPSDTVDVTFKYEHQDVWQRGSAGEYTVCELRPQFSRANGTIAPGLPAPCALDAIVNGSNINVLDGRRGTGGSLDIRATVDALNAAPTTGATTRRAR
jgi:iron complex outermembrane receptor protein